SYSLPRYTTTLYLHPFPTRRSSDLICLRAWSFRNRTKNPKSRIAQRPCAFYARASTNSSRKSSKRPSSQSAAGRSKAATDPRKRSEEHTSELQSLRHLVCRLLLEKK